MPFLCSLVNSLMVDVPEHEPLTGGLPWFARAGAPSATARPTLSAAAPARRVLFFMNSLRSGGGLEQGKFLGDPLRRQGVAAFFTIPVGTTTTGRWHPARHRR